eukprot:GILJ01006862.1.p1 GENE.GILJ01006862.1~~GILJ01006862.1.p1  ORF type:complete len:227 (-),score=34.97 GILJ01006862.1:288-968(-)
MSLLKKMHQDYLEFDKTNTELVRMVKAEIKHYRNDTEFFRNPSVLTKLEHITIAYLNYYHEEYSPGLVHMLGPFVYSLQKESDQYYCFQSFLKAREDFFSTAGINKCLANFLMLFRTMQSELYNYFEEEELEPNEWAMPWMQYLLCRELPLESLLRLWDTYFASHESFDLHVYVCLAILEHWNEYLIELDYAEIKAFLQHLPVMDMDQIITQAYNKREEVLALDLI